MVLEVGRGVGTCCDGFYLGLGRSIEARVPPLDPTDASFNRIGRIGQALSCWVNVRCTHLRLLHGDVHVPVEAREDAPVVHPAVQLDHHGLAADGLEEVRGGLGGAGIWRGVVGHVSRSRVGGRCAP